MSDKGFEQFADNLQTYCNENSSASYIVGFDRDKWRKYWENITNPKTSPVNEISICSICGEPFTEETGHTTGEHGLFKWKTCPLIPEGEMRLIQSF